MGGNRIGQQESELEHQIVQLTELLKHNKDLYQQIRLAAANTATLNEDLLRRISAELHDGPVQEISLALLRLDQAIAQSELCRFDNPGSVCNQSLPAIQIKLQASLQEMRSIATSLGLPQLDNMLLMGVIMHVVQAHEQRTRTEVFLKMNGLPEQTSLPVKIAAYRFVQEGLSNAFRHADGQGQEVYVTCKSNQMQIEIMDQGPGFDHQLLMESTEHLGLASMQERIESLGGFFSVDNNTERGSKLIARLPLQNLGEI